MSNLEYKKAYNKEVREWRKSKGICTRCGKEKADDGYVTCLVCRMDRREEARKLYERQPLTDEARILRNEKRRMRVAEKRRNGICLQCSKPVYMDHAYCHEHYISQKRADEKHRKKLYPYHPAGTCRICGKEPAPGKKMCPVHHREYSERMIKYNKERTDGKKSTDD